jgi:WD40 repeat protein
MGDGRKQQELNAALRDIRAETAAPKKPAALVAAPPKPPAQPENQDSEDWQVLRTLKGHADGVNSVAWSPDGSRIVSGSGDTTIKIWEKE